MSDEIVLYDLPSRQGLSWSANSLKTRAYLNYKQIAYRTAWTPYYKLQETLKATGLPANIPPRAPEYTVPAVRLPDGRMVMESAVITVELEKLYPSPNLHVDDPLVVEVTKDAINPIIRGLVPYFMPKLARDIIVEEDIPWYHEDRGKYFKMDLDELEKLKGGEEAWTNTKDGFAKLEELLARDESGPFLMGSEVSYGDFIVLAAVRMFECIGEEGYERFLGGAKGLREMYERGRQWVVTR